MSQIGKNTVRADNQLKNDSKVTFEGNVGNGIRIIFVGNSITRHAPKSEIGWINDHGMAASSKNKDYVHILEKKILQKRPDATFCICQAADWECVYQKGEDTFPKFENASDFSADILVMRIIENCNPKDFEGENSSEAFGIFKEQYMKFHKILCKNKNAKTIITSGFWKHPADGALKEIADESGFDFVYLGDLGEDACMRAEGLFEHKGVAAHPGDNGMASIAARIFDSLDKYL